MTFESRRTSPQPFFLWAGSLSTWPHETIWMNTQTAANVMTGGLSVLCVYWSWMIITGSDHFLKITRTWHMQCQSHLQAGADILRLKLCTNTLTAHLVWGPGLVAGAGWWHDECHVAAPCDPALVMIVITETTDGHIQRVRCALWSGWPRPCSTAALQYIIWLPVWESWASSGLDTVDSVDTRLVTQQQSRYVASHCRVIKLYRVAGA